MIREMVTEEHAGCEGRSQQRKQLGQGCSSMHIMLCSGNGKRAQQSKGAWQGPAWCQERRLTRKLRQIWRGLICPAKELGLLLLFYFIYFWCDTTWPAGSQFPYQGKHGFLTTGPPGKSLFFQHFKPGLVFLTKYTVSVCSLLSDFCLSESDPNVSASLDLGLSGKSSQKSLSLGKTATASHKLDEQPRDHGDILGCLCEVV